MAGGVLWAGAALVAGGRARAACSDCHRSGSGRDGPAWGRAATYLAVALALPYPLVRICWALRIPVGVPAAYVEDERLGGLALLGLGAVPLAGALLTLGLTQRWGERFPPRIPLLGGRPVSVALAVVPAAGAALLIVQGGVRIVVWTVTGDQPLSADTWGTSLPGLFWLPWGLALAAATYAYHLRRREPCPRCGTDRPGPEE